jgi:hypothetical protein
VWCDHGKAKISEEFVSKIEKMYKQSEGNCEPTENELKDYIDMLHLSKDPDEKKLAAKGTGNYEIIQTVKENKINGKK